MFSRYSSRQASPARHWIAAAAIVFLSVSTIQCGKKGPPKPPPSKIPSPITDLEVQQRGMEMLLRMAYPTTTIGGIPLETVEAIEIFEMKRIIPAFTDTPELDVEGSEATEASDFVQDSAVESDEEPTTLVEDVAELEEEEDPDEGLLFRAATEVEEVEEESKVDRIEVDPREFDLVAQLSWRAAGDELDSATLGDSIIARIPIEAITEIEEIHIFGARVYASEKLVSANSNLAKILPQEPPPPPEDLEIEPKQTGIKISWSTPESTDPEAEEDSGIDTEGFNVYRRNADVREYGPPIFTAPDGIEKFTDTTAAFDQRYIYTVTTILSKDPLIESAVAAEYEVNYKDRFAPDPPREVTALPETGQVRLLWERSPSEDVVGYRIYRQDPGGEFLLITPEAISGSEYLDQQLPGGQLYGYFIVAVDEAGNQSEASDPVEVRVP